MRSIIRKIFFYSLLVVFVIGGTGVILYSEGFVFDWEDFSLKKGGAIYIETTPKDIEINLNQKIYEDKSSLLQKGTLISGIVPKKYHLTLKKGGYFDYEKNIDLQPSAVARILNVLFVPQKTEPQKEFGDIKTGTLLQWLPDGRFIINDRIKNINYLYNFKNPDIFINLNSKISSFFKQKIIKIALHPQEENKVIVQTSQGIYIADINKQQTSSVSKKETTFFTTHQNNLFFFSKEKSSKAKNATTTCQMETFDLVLNSIAQEQKIDCSETEVSAVSFYQNLAAINLASGSLFIKELPAGEKIEIGHSVKKALFSDDGEKLLYQDKDGKIFVYLLKDDLTNLDAKKGNKIRMGIIDGSKIEELWWFGDSYHLLIKYPDKISLAEITKTEPNNHFKLLPKKENVFYSQSDSKIYFIENNFLYSLALE